ncbi:DNA cytosine methyltransferase [Massilia timonae]|uniref:Cytosine-specific methyltransferase n=1 Tax=Massilia timonae TaxID=47229 RepID=A0A1S2N6V8_9BURK|nr:DNA (cytosine-5-)-methyltransferase [Massilia timonae]OIJ40817.1 DNA (cytosine-5-)-methyltransferase family protein [Massilia timonae]
MPYDLTDEQRQVYRETSRRSQQRKIELLQRAIDNLHEDEGMHEPRLNPETLMPQAETNGLAALSLFSGGGGLDLGFERGGFTHVASYELLEIGAKTLSSNRPTWEVFGGVAGDVRGVDWRNYRGIVDVIHGGPPCQPFSIAGRQAGIDDPRNMWPEFVRCVLEVQPRAFIAENVPGLLDEKFSGFVEEFILKPLRAFYKIRMFVLKADDFGVPQARKRVFFVGFLEVEDFENFVIPLPTHGDEAHLLPKNTARYSLGLPDIGFDCVVPTLRSGFTGPRNTTSVVNSKASMNIWNSLQIWPHGVQRSRAQAIVYPPENGHYRLSGTDCGILQGFPQSWVFEGAAYQILGQIGNSVCPPVAYAVATSVAAALRRADDRAG